MDPFRPPPPTWMVFWFHAVGMLTWNLIGGAAGSSGWMSPRIRQSSGGPGVTRGGPPFSGAGATSVAEVMGAPEVASPTDDAGARLPASAAQAESGAFVGSAAVSTKAGSLVTVAQPA